MDRQVVEEIMAEEKCGGRFVGSHEVCRMVF